MLQNMIRGRIEQACYWCAELVCAGQYLDAWENIFHFMSKHIHIGNAKMPFYVERRFTIFRNIVEEGLYTNELQLRNHAEIRKLFAEVICNLTLSPRKPSFEPVKIHRQDEFDITNLNERIKAPSRDFAGSAFRPKDPAELFIAVNEFAFQLNAKNTAMCCYWIEWVIEFDSICKSRKQPVRCIARDYVEDKKYRSDIIWLIWDVLMEASESKEDPFVQRILDSLLKIFCVRYTTASSKKRRYILYMAVELLTEPVSTTTDIVADKVILANVIEKIDSVYKQIKKNEQRGKTDYLFSGVDSNASFESTIARLDMMSSLDII